MEDSDWLADYSYMDDGETVAVADFVYPSAGFNCWTPSPFDSFSDASMEVNYSFGESESSKESGTPRKRLKSSESFNASISSLGTKAVREKIRRGRINERFLELGSVLEPGKPANRMDKVVILDDAVRALIHLRNETKKLKKSIGHMEEKIKDLKAEKNELRDENQKLKVDKERMEVQLKAMSIQQHTYLQQPHPTAALSAANKVVPCLDYRYPSVAMWQYLPQAVVDTSRDHILRPPVA